MTVQLLAQWGPQPRGTLYTSDANTEAAMIANGQATATLTGAVAWVPNAGSPGNGNWPGLTTAQVAALDGMLESTGVATTNTAAVNTALINARLAQGGFVTLTRPGRYLVTNLASAPAAIYVPSDTEFVIGKGVELYLADASNCALIMNQHATSLGTIIVAGNLVASGSNFQINQAGILALYPVDSWISIDFVATKGYQGVFQVAAASTASQLIFAGQSGNLVTTSPATRMLTDAPIGPGPAATALNMVVRPANNNIVIRGGGLINGNGANNTLILTQGDPRGLGIYIRGCANFTIDGLFFKRAQAWTVALNNTLNAIVRNLTVDNAGGSNATDAVHSTGENRSELIENIYAVSISDNVVGSTLDYTNTAGTALPYPWFTPGDNNNSVIRNIGARNTAFSIVTKWGNANFAFTGTHVVENIHGFCSSGNPFQMSTYAQTTMNSCNGGTLRISNITAICNSAAVSLSGSTAAVAGTWDLIEIDNVRTIRGTQANVQLGGASNHAGTIKQLKIRNLTYINSSDGVNRTTAAIQVGGGLAATTSIGYLDVSDVEEIPLAANVPLISIGSGATTLASIKRISLHNVAATGLSGTGSLVQVALASTIGEITMTAARYTGVGSTGNLVNIGASVVAGTQVSFGAGCAAPSAAGFITAATTIGRLNGANAQFDPAAGGGNITAPIPGDTFYNTNASFGVPGVGVYVRGASTWTRTAA